MDNNFLDWLTAETEKASEDLREAAHASPQWIMAFHRLEVLDECARQYRSSQVSGERRRKA